MANKIILRGRSITRGVAEGKAMVTRQFFGFTHGVEPFTGTVCDERHEWLGQNIKGKVLVFPYGKSSSSGGLFILETIRSGNAPAALINREVEPVIGAGFIMAKIFYNREIPAMDRFDQDPLEIIENGDFIRVDADHGIVEISKEP